MDSNIKFLQSLISGFAIGSLYLDIQSKELIKKPHAQFFEYLFEIKHLKSVTNEMLFLLGWMIIK